MCRRTTTARLSRFSVLFICVCVDVECSCAHVIYCFSFTRRKCHIHTLDIPVRRVRLWYAALDRAYLREGQSFHEMLMDFFAYKRAFPKYDELKKEVRRLDQELFDFLLIEPVRWEMSVSEFGFSYIYSSRLAFFKLLTTTRDGLRVVECET